MVFDMSKPAAKSKPTAKPPNRFAAAAAAPKTGENNSGDDVEILVSDKDR